MTETAAVALSNEQRQDLALKAKARIQELQQGITTDFIEMARLLQAVEDQHLWDVEHESYWEFLEDCGLTTDQARKMVEVARHVLPSLSDAQAREMGKTKLVRLLPIARIGKLDAEMVGKAIVLSDRHLRQEMGHTIIEPTEQKIKCPQCGYMVPLGYKRSQMQEPVASARNRARPVNRPAPTVEATADEPDIESVPFTPPPTVKLSPEEMEIYQRVVKLGLDNDMSTARITKNLIQAHGMTRIKAAADEAIKSGRGYPHFAQIISGISAAPAPKETVESYRLTITETQRNRIFKRDGFKCVQCASTENLKIDHIKPFVEGGKTEDNNLQTLCAKCNYKKRGR